MAAVINSLGHRLAPPIEVLQNLARRDELRAARQCRFPRIP